MIFCNLHQYIDNLTDQNGTKLYSNGSDHDVEAEVGCAEGFYLDNSSRPLCRPLCSYWLSVSGNSGNTVIEAISMTMAIVSSLILVVLALWPQRDTM